MTAWVATVPIPLEVAEGPAAWAAIQHAKDQVRGCALLEGVDPDTLGFHLLPPAQVHGVPVPAGTCPMTGEPIPSPYTLRAQPIQEN